jgi:thioester reductase-like protein
VNPVFTEASSPVLGPALLPPSGTLLKEIMRQQKLRALYVPPAIAEQLLQEPQGIEFFRHLDFLCYTGAPFSPTAGKQLVEVTELCSLYGSTEAFQVPQLVPSKEDWAYMEWNPTFKLEMQPSDDEIGAFEMVLFTDDSTERMSALNHNLPGTTEWRTKDLFMPHPTKPNLWTYFGRRDDIIVLSNSEKFNPVPMELRVQGHPSLAGALVVGQGRVRASLLVEPRSSVQGEARRSLISEIWPRVEEANGLVPGHGRILRSNITIVNRPFTRAGKGTVVRKLTEKDFDNEINALYTSGEATMVPKYPALMPPFDHSTIVKFLREIVTSCFPAACGINDSEDLFSYGLDSLVITDLVATLKYAIQPAVSFSVSWMSPITIYQNPTVLQLTTLLEAFLHSGEIPNNDSEHTRTSKMKDLIHSYTKDLPLASVRNSSSKKTGLAVAMTGATGSLGTVILAELLAHRDISCIYCLIRGPAAKERQQKILIDRGFEKSNFTKLEFMTVDIGEPKLGLNTENFDRLVEDIDIILHNAWKVDFNLSLQSFDAPYLQSVRNLVELSYLSKSKARLYFVTSVSAVMGSLSVIEESPALDFSAVLKLGYAESKCVAEGIRASASERSGVQVTILRVGQCGGSTIRDDPPWPKQEWLYPVIKVSKSIGLIPSSLAPIDWIPINQVASIVSEVITPTIERDDLQVFNIVNPTPVAWRVLVEVLQERFGKNAKIVPLQEWSEKVRNYDSKELAGPTLEPALRLLSQLGEGKESIKYVTETTSATSKTFASLKPISKQLLMLWLDQWGL